MTAFALLNFTSMSIIGLLPLFLYTPTSLGGTGFSALQIGKALSAQAIGSAVIQLTLFPPLQRRFGTIATLRFGAVFYTLACMMFPLTSFVAQRERTSRSDGDRTWTWVALTAQITVLCFGGFAFSSSALVNNAAAPNRRSLGTLNGLGQSVSSLMRSLALAGTPALFALTINKGWLGGRAIWIFMTLSGLAFVLASWRVKDAVAEWRNESKTADQDGEAPTA